MHMLQDTRPYRVNAGTQIPRAADESESSSLIIDKLRSQIDWSKFKICVGRALRNGGSDGKTKSLSSETGDDRFRKWSLFKPVGQKFSEHMPDGREAQSKWNRKMWARWNQGGNAEVGFWRDLPIIDWGQYKLNDSACGGASAPHVSRLTLMATENLCEWEGASPFGGCFN